MNYRTLTEELDKFEKDWLDSQSDLKNYSIVKLTLTAMRRRCEYLFKQYKIDEIDRKEKKFLKQSINKYRNRIQVLDNSECLLKSESD